MKSMKKFSLLLMAAMAVFAVSCEKNSGGEGGDGGDGGDGGSNGSSEYYTTQQSRDNAGNLIPNTYDLGNGNQEYPFKGHVTLDASKKYLLRGWVYITDGSSITIPAGTVILGDKDTKAALIIERGGKIHATGTAQKPIVFTSEQPAGSRRPGDWGGIIICGKAKNNLNEMQIEGGPRTKHGGDDDADNSGELQYVRVEFAGYPFKTDQEINGITFGSVGSGTKIDHLQVSYSNGLAERQITNIWCLTTVGMMTSIRITASRVKYSTLWQYAIRKLPTNRSRIALNRITMLMRKPLNPILQLVSATLR